MGPSCWPILTVRQCVIADGVGYPRTRFRSGVMPVAHGDGPATSAAFNVLEGRRESSPAYQRWDPGQLIPR